MMDIAATMLSELSRMAGFAHPSSLREYTGVTAFYFGLFEIVPYIMAMVGRDLFQFGSKLAQRTVPNRATWLIWAFEGAVVAPANIAAGAVETAGVPVAYEIGYVIVFLLSIRYGEGGLTRTDLTCIGLAVASGVAGFIWHTPEVAIMVPLAVDLFGAAPTIKNCCQDPEKESMPAWSLTFAVSILNFSAIDWEAAQFGVLLFPMYMIVVNTAIVAPLWANWWRKK